MTLDDRLRRTFAVGLNIPEDSDFESLAYRGIEEWDSVAHMMLVSEIESEFGVMLDTEDVLAMSSFPIARETVLRLQDG